MGRTIPKIKEFPDDGRIWRVDWFGSIERNPQVPTEPRVQVIISPILEGSTNFTASGSIDHDERKPIYIGVGQLPLITIGSLWLHRNLLPSTAGNRHTFANLIISPNTVRSVKSNAFIDGDFLIRKRYHQIGVGLSANCLAIEWEGDPYGIIIPAVEIIRFYYATSSDLAKALFAGAFRHDLHSIVNIDECGFDSVERRAFLKVRKEYSDADAWIIARILNSTEAFAGATLVHDSLIKQAAQSQPRAYPEAAFPFSGRTSLCARIKKMKTKDDKWRHIVFALEHCTGEFPYDAITFERDNSNLRANDETDLPDDEKKGAFHQASTMRSGGNENGELQSDEEPSNYKQGEVVELPEQRFGALAGLDLDKPEKEMCRYINAGTIRPLDLPTAVLGTGDGTFAENGITPTSIEVEPTRQSALPASFENFKAVVVWLNTSTEYCAQIRSRSDVISHIPLTKPRSARQWSYLNSELKTRRAVVIADITHQERMFSLIEFEWRENESFKLAVLFFQDGARVNDQIMSTILHGLARKSGRWENIGTLLPAGMRLITLKHTWPSVEACASAIQGRIHA